MKKILVLALVIILSNCQIKVEPKAAQAQSNTIGKDVLVTEAINGTRYLPFKKHTIEGIEYHVYWSDGVEVVNHTKEKLEVDLLKLQIRELKKTNPFD